MKKLDWKTAGVTAGFVLLVIAVAGRTDLTRGITNALTGGNPYWRG